jgi:hypothetical protein
MIKPHIYYREQCDLCIERGKCRREKRTRKFIETICGMEVLANGVYGSLSFRCNYFDLDKVAYNKASVHETEG